MRAAKSSLILKKPKTKKSNRILYMTKPLKEELLAWLEKLKQDEQSAPEKYSNCGTAVPAPGRSAHRTGAADEMVPSVESGAPGV